jgi:acyl-CoA dehydrogenase-like protein
MMDAAEHALLEDTVRAALAADPTRADAVLSEVGWLEMLDSEPRDAIEIVFEVLGTSNAAATALDDVLVSALGRKPRADLAVLLPTYGTWTPPGAAGLASDRISVATELLTVFDDGREVRAVSIAPSSVDARAIGGIDPSARLHSVRFDESDTRGETLDRALWDAAVALGRRAVAHQMAGASRVMLDLARAHAVERVQFDRPIARFQAVRHRLADALVAVEALAATLQTAGDAPNSLTAALAKATAGRATRTVATHCQQVLAGIGFTTEHPFHRYLKRTMLLDGILGAADDITRDVGRQLIAARTVPTLIEL